MRLPAILTDVRHFQIFFLGIFSGMPLAVIYFTLSIWLRESGVEIKLITTLALSRVFYSLKVCWAPFIDHIKIPVLNRIGMRKSWMILCAAVMSFLMYGYSSVNPSESFEYIYYLTIALGVASATFDIAFDAFRIEKLDANMQAMGAANTIFGYRTGMWIANAGVLLWAEVNGWSSAFIILSLLYVVCILFLLAVSEIEVKREGVSGLTLRSWKIMVFDPFADFFKRQYAITILLAVIFYKLGEAMLGVVAGPFYVDLGFTKSEISYVIKSYGLAATIIGSYAGGYLLFKKGDLKGLIIAGIAQSITNLSFIWLHHQGHDIQALMIAITIENIASGMGSAALISYLSNLCNRQYSATQYALFSSASGLFSHTIVVYGGWILDIIGWDLYFIMTIILAIPGLVLFYLLDKWINSPNKDAQLKSISIDNK